VLVSDPVGAEPIVRARNEERQNFDKMTPDKALATLITQLGTLQDLRDIAGQLQREGYRGNFDYRTSTLLPHCFLAHSRKLAVFGLFIAHGSYSDGPMMVADAQRCSKLFQTLQEDWSIRWNHAARTERAYPERTQFAELLGVPSRSAKGALILRADSLSHLAKPWLGTGLEPSVVGTERIFKARRWTNACDVEAAQALIRIQ
jgi:hypothetical protein